MSSASTLSQVVLIATGGVLFYVGLTDFKHYKIRNNVILLLGALFFIYIAVSGGWMRLVWNLGFSFLLFVILLIFYAMRIIGGGDLKLLTVAFLWVGPLCAMPFALFLLLFSGIHLVAGKFKLVETPEGEGGHKLIAFGPSIAAALIGVFMTGCLNNENMLSFYYGLGAWTNRLIFDVFPHMPHTG